jgi:hypothetical protein
MWRGALGDFDVDALAGLDEGLRAFYPLFYYWNGLLGSILP